MGETKKEIVTRLKNIESKLDMLLRRIDSATPQDQVPIVGGLEFAIQLTGLARSTIYNLVSDRKLPHYKKGKRLYFKRSELEKWIEGGKRNTEEEIRTIASKWNKGKSPL